MTLPMMLTPPAPPVVQQMQGPACAVQQAPSPYSILFDEVENVSLQDKPEKQYGMAQISCSPEIVGSDDALFLD